QTCALPILERSQDGLLATLRGDRHDLVERGVPDLFPVSLGVENVERECRSLWGGKVVAGADNQSGSAVQGHCDPPCSWRWACEGPGRQSGAGGGVRGGATGWVGP